VVLSVVIDRSGRPVNLRVIRGLGLGLDERAIAAVAQWRFEPGRENGAPVDVQATVEVNFRLL
jgi:protein TonB